MPEWIDTETGAAPTDREVQQLISAERGHPGAGQRRRWFRPDADVTVLTVDETGLKVSPDTGTTPPAPPIVVGSPAGGDLTGTYPNPTFVGSTLDALIPPGTIWAYAGATAPAGWLPCNGMNVRRADYPELFAVIRTDYGDAGGDAERFSLPNLAGRTLLGESGTHPRGQVGGAESTTGAPHTHPGTHSHDLNAHTHGLADHVHAGSSHTHGLNGHVHELDLAHDHFPVGTTRPIPTSPAVGTNGLALTGGVNLPEPTHWHNFDVPALATNTRPTAAPSAPLTDTGSPSAGPTGAPSPAGSLGPVPVASGTSAAAPAAAYPGTIATMSPYGVALYIIRTGA